MRRVFIVIAVCLSGCGSLNYEDAAETYRSQTEGNGSATNVFQRCGIATPAVYETGRPDSLCGIQGYAYMHATYFRTQCGSCHYQGSFIHPNAFGDANINTAFSASRFIASDRFLETTLHNKFVPTNCLLKPGEPLERDLREWVTKRDGC